MKNRRIKIKAVAFDVSSIVRLIKYNSNIILLFSMFICGLVIGTVSIQKSENYRLLFNAVFFVENEFVRVFINRLLINLTVLTSNFVMGLCLVGAPFINFVSVLEGIYIGSVYSFQLYTNGFNGIGKFIISQIIFYIFSYIIILYSQILSIKMSEELKLSYCSVNRGEASLRVFLLKYVCISVISVVISLVSAMLT